MQFPAKDQEGFASNDQLGSVPMLFKMKSEAASCAIAGRQEMVTKRMKSPTMPSRFLEGELRIDFINRHSCRFV